MDVYNMFDWLEFHKCVLDGGCKFLDISEQTLIIDLGVLVVLFGIGTGIKRFIKGEKVLSRKKERKAQIPLTL